MKKLSAEAREYFREAGARGGKIGGKARMKKLSPERRSEIAKYAVAIRELKRRMNGTPAALVPTDNGPESQAQKKKVKS